MHQEIIEHLKQRIQQAAPNAFAPFPIHVDDHHSFLMPGRSTNGPRPYSVCIFELLGGKQESRPAVTVLANNYNVTVSRYWLTKTRQVGHSIESVYDYEGPDMFEELVNQIVIHLQSQYDTRNHSRASRKAD